ncbi:hypothetical protein Salat_2134900 [Sesamum alatum]|uniref:Uncharacterized protein n=1 Tax=Sesamum alatum TaxID=300844 RepID=A0AAE1Y2D9_9LAMI|nr:hypothetical protein Salat_2134900 [Sesamum alatum]
MENLYGVFAPRPTLGECFFPFTLRSGSLGLALIDESIVPINFKAVRERIKSAGLLDHGFRAKALLEEDLLIVAGLYPVKDPYIGPESCYSRHWTPSSVPPGPASHSLYTSDVPPEPLVIEVVTSPQADTTLAPSESPPSLPFVSPPEAGSSSQKRPRVEGNPQEEFFPGGDSPQTPAFPSRVMTPQYNRKARLSNTCKTVHCEDVNSLDSPTITVTMVERYEKVRKSLVMSMSQLRGAHSQMKALNKQPTDEGTNFREELKDLKNQLEKNDLMLVV